MIGKGGKVFLDPVGKKIPQPDTHPCPQGSNNQDLEGSGDQAQYLGRIIWKTKWKYHTFICFHFYRLWGMKSSNNIIIFKFLLETLTYTGFQLFSESENCFASFKIHLFFAS